MTQHIVHDVNSAPAASTPLLEAAQKSLGFVPNLFGTLADAPAALESYLELSRLFDSTSFSPLERQVVLLSASFENGCEYCMAAHSTIAGMQQLDESVIEALRAGRPLTDSKLETLASFTRDVVASRGFVEDASRDAFLAAGYTPAQVLEVVLGVTMKTLSNYTSHIADQEVDAAFAPKAWKRPALAN